MPISKTYPLPALTDVDDTLDPDDGEVLTWDGDSWTAKPITLAAAGAWNTGHLQLGGYHLWVDAAGKLRVKSGAPTTDLDGVTVGSQT